MEGWEEEEVWEKGRRKKEERKKRERERESEPEDGWKKQRR